MNRDIAIVVPTFHHHLPWLRASLESCKKLGYYILLAYDNYFRKFKEIDRCFPSNKVMSMADSVIMKHPTEIGSVGLNHMWNMLYAMNFIKDMGFPYVYSIAGDCVMETPENFPKMLELLEGHDIICTQYDDKRGYCGTIGVITRTEIYHQFFEEYAQQAYMRLASTEGRLYKFIKKNNLKIVKVRNSAHNFKMPDPNSDWNRILGFRHLHSETAIRRESRYLPIEKELMDFGENYKHIGGPNSFLGKYYATGDIKHLDGWWGPLR